MPRKTPQKREPRKPGKTRTKFTAGQRIKITGEKKSTKAVVLRAKGTEVVARIKRTFKSVPTKTPFGRGKLVQRRRELIEQAKQEYYGSKRAIELEKQIRDIEHKLRKMPGLQPVVITHTKTQKIPVEQIETKETKTVKGQDVPKTQRRKQRRKTLIENARRDYRGKRWGKAKNPKRIQRELKRKGITADLTEITGRKRIQRKKRDEWF